MEEELIRKVKRRRIRLVAILVVVALFAGSAAWAMFSKQARENKAAAEPAATALADAEAEGMPSMGEAVEEKHAAGASAGTESSAAKKAGAESTAEQAEQTAGNKAAGNKAPAQNVKNSAGRKAAETTAKGVAG